MSCERCRSISTWAKRSPVHVPKSILLGGFAAVTERPIDPMVRCFALPASTRMNRTFVCRGGWATTWSAMCIACCYRTVVRAAGPRHGPRGLLGSARYIAALGRCAVVGDAVPILPAVQLRARARLCSPPFGMGVRPTPWVKYSLHCDACASSLCANKLENACFPLGDGNRCVEP
jgi:hypothetical protein